MFDLKIHIDDVRNCLQEDIKEKVDNVVEKYPLTPKREPRIRCEKSSISDDVVHVTQKNSTFLFVSVFLFAFFLTSVVDND